MLICELARAAGMTAATIRFYEREGLLDGGHMARRDNNYRDYRPAALERLHFIVQAKSAGFTLSEIKELLLEWDTLASAERRKILLDKIGQIERRMAELGEMKAYLAAKVARLAEQAH